MELLIKSHLGQWTLVKSDDPYTIVHYSDGTKKKFNYRHQAVSHLLLDDYINHDNSNTFRHIHEHGKTAEVVTHQPALERLRGAPPKRRKND
jgi:hypothetical protein